MNKSKEQILAHNLMSYFLLTTEEVIPTMWIFLSRLLINQTYQLAFQLSG